MEYFIEIIEHKNEFYVNHNKLQDYGVIGKKVSSTKIKDCLD